MSSHRDSICMDFCPFLVQPKKKLFFIRRSYNDVGSSFDLLDVIMCALENIMLENTLSLDV